MVTIADVAQWRREKASVNHETYKMLHGQVENRIKQMVETNVRATQVFYAIPAFVPGRPVYNPMHAKRYIAEKIRRAGFLVVEHDYPQHALVIDWSSPPPKPKTKTTHKGQGRSTAAASSSQPDGQTTTTGGDISNIARQLANLKKVIGA